jgi:hypothetical protein
MEATPMTDEQFDEDPFPVKHAACIGLAVMSWADLEFEIDFTIWDLMDCPQALSACLTAQLISPIPKLNALQSLVRLYQFGGDLEERLSQFAGNIGGLVEQRNRIIHDKRIYDPATPLSVRRINVTAKTRLKFAEQPESMDDLKEFAKRVVTARSKFIEIRDAIIVARDASRALPAEQKPRLPQIIRRLVAEVPTSDPTEC